MQSQVIWVCRTGVGRGGGTWGKSLAKAGKVRRWCHVVRRTQMIVELWVSIKDCGWGCENGCEGGMCGQESGC